MGEAMYFIGFVLVVGALSVVRARLHSPVDVESERVRLRHGRTAPTPIGALPAHQLCRIVGRVTASEKLLTAPLTGRPCVHYTLAISELRGKRWVTRATDRRGVIFTIEDHSGRAIIEPTNAQVVPDFDHVARTGLVHSLTREHQALLARHGIAPGAANWTGAFQFHEAVIAVGDRVDVIGAGVRELDPTAPVESGYRTAAPTRLYISHSVEAPLSILCGPQP